MPTNATKYAGAAGAATFVRSVERAVAASRLYTAFQLIRDFAGADASAQLRSNLNALEQTYGFMLRYLLDGQADPGRKAMYADLCAQTLHLADMAARDNLTPLEASMYYSTLRTLTVRRESLSAIITRLTSAIAESSLMPDSKSARTAYEETLGDFFDSLWIATDISDADAVRIANLICADDAPAEVPMMTIGALLLGSLQFFETSNLKILARAYSDAGEAVQAYALTAIMLIARRHKRRITMLPEATQILQTIVDIPGTEARLRTLLMLSLRTLDTDRVATKMTQEVVPEIMKLQPEIMKRLKDAGQTPDPEALAADINPEWEDMIEKSGLGDKLRELTDMQQEGADVMMLAFSNLKSFPFFRRASNWLRPFSAESSEAAVALGNHGKLIRQMLEMPGMLCDSDRFSFVLALPHMPQQQRDFMNQQLSAQAEAMREDDATSLAASGAAFEREALRFMRNLFRFYRLYPQRKGLPDPFASWSEATSVPLALSSVLDLSTLQVMAEFLFRRKYYAEALDIYMRMADIVAPDGATLEKIGFCQQTLGQTDEALETYKKAEYTRPNSLWLIRRLAAMLYSSGRFEEAIPYLQRALEKKPDSAALAMKLGHALLEINDREGALKQYYKVEYQHPERLDARRAIAWTLLLEGQYDKSRSIYDELLLTDACASDYLDAGHLALIQHRMGEAAALYREAAKSEGAGAEWLTEQFAADRKHLLKAGVDSHEALLVLDSVCHDLNA